MHRTHDFTTGVIWRGTLGKAIRIVKVTGGGDSGHRDGQLNRCSVWTFATAVLLSLVECF